MFKFLVKRFVYAIFTLWVVVTITFIMMMGIPGNPFAGERKLPPAVIENLNRHFKLDQPLIVQYGSYMKNLVTLDFGPSMKSQTVTVNQYIANGLPISMQLGFQALVIALIFGLLFGIIAALYHNKAADYFATILAIIGVSVPSFVMARILIIIFTTNLGWVNFGGWDSFEKTILPTIALAALPLATITRLMRSSMLEVLGQDYMKTAKAKGLKKSAIVIKHAIRNSILPIVSMLGTIITNLVTGSFVIEKIFGIPGLGETLIKSVQNRDYPLIIAATVVYSSILIIMVLIVDISYVFIDPRIKLIGGEKSGRK